MNWFKSFFKSRPTPRTKGNYVWDARAADEAMANFTPRVQQVLALSRKEADRFHHNFVGTEHLLLGLIALGQGTAVMVLCKLGLNLETVRDEVEKQVGLGPEPKVLGNIPYTPRVKKVLAFAAKEARDMNHSYVGTEHILLGLLRDGEGVAARVLKHFDIDTEATRREILKELDPNTLHRVREQKPLTPPVSSIDTTKHYDVYCAEQGQKIVVYRKARFKGRARLLGKSSQGVGTEFLELEQANGQTVFVSSFSVVKFCEHGVELSGEPMPPQ